MEEEETGVEGGRATEFRNSATGSRIPERCRTYEFWTLQSPHKCGHYEIPQRCETYEIPQRRGNYDFRKLQNSGIGFS
jgi:hypothetical protein